MKKNLKDRVVSILLVFAVIGTSYGFRVVATDMITEISVKEISGVSENDAESAEDDNETMDTESVVEDTDIDADEQLITDDVDDVPVWGDKALRGDVVKWKKLYPEENNYVFTLPDCSVLEDGKWKYKWEYQQSYARKEIFNYLNTQRMDPANHKNAMKDNDGNWKSLTDCGMELLIENIKDENNKVIRQDRYDFIYDYNLEAAAMQRAAELAVSYSHDRPDKIPVEEVLKEVWVSPVKRLETEIEGSNDEVNPYWYGVTNELITVYESDLDKRPQHWDCYGIVEDFMEENKPAGGQKHREAILTRSYRRIGIGCIKTDENKYFVAVELGKDEYEDDFLYKHPDVAATIPLAPETTAVDTYMPVTIRIAPGLNIHCCLLSAQTGSPKTTLKVGETFDFGNEYFCESSDNNTVALWKGTDPAMGTKWYSTDESVAKVEGTTITAVGAGTCNIKSTGSSYAYGLIGVKVESPAPAVSPTPSTAPSVKPSADPSPAPTPSAKPSAAPSAEPSVQPSSTPAQAPQKIEVAKQFKKTCTVKYADIKKKKKTLKLGVKVNNGKAHGAVTYKVTKYPKGAKKCVTVNKKGVVTIKKGAKKGTYKIKVTANSNAKMKKATKTVTIKIK